MKTLIIPVHILIVYVKTLIVSTKNHDRFLYDANRFCENTYRFH